MLFKNSFFPKRSPELIKSRKNEITDAYQHYIMKKIKEIKLQ